MILNWEPFWYELDQTIVVGDIDYFYLEMSGSTFSRGGITSEDEEVKAEILKISHQTWGSIKGILANDPCYTVFLEDGRKYFVNAEEYPGRVYDSDTRLKSDIIIDDWHFDVEVKILERTGLSSRDRLQISPHSNWHIENKNLEGKYKRLLEVDAL